MRKSVVRLRLRAAIVAHPEVVTTSGDSGYAAVDALVALTILASTLSLSIVATQTARRTSEAALDVRRANNLLEYVMLSASDRMGKQTGETNGFVWRLNTDLSAIGGATNMPAICVRKLEVRSNRTHRVFGFETEEVCPLAEHASPAA